MLSSINYERRLKLPLLTSILNIKCIRCRTLLVEKQESLRTWHHKIPAHIGRHLSIKSFVEDSVSPLLHILSPPTLRPVCSHYSFHGLLCHLSYIMLLFRITPCYAPQVASHLLSDRQKEQLAGLVMLMCSYSLTYKNKTQKSDPALSNLREEAASDTTVLALDPHLFDFISFKVLFLLLLVH